MKNYFKIKTHSDVFISWSYQKSNKLSIKTISLISRVGFANYLADSSEILVKSSIEIIEKLEENRNSEWNWKSAIFIAVN